MLHFPLWKTILVAMVCAFGVVYTVPNFLPRDLVEGLPRWLPSQQISLGLDLQGGSHLLLEVDVGTVVKERLTNLVDSVRGALRRTQIGYTELGVRGEDAVQVTLRDPARTEEARRLIREAETNVEVTVEPGNRLVVRYPETALFEMRRSAVDQSIEIVRRRVDETGTKEPTIQRQGDDRILLQLPGVDDPERVKALLGRTAKLTFRLVDMNASVEEARRGRVPAGTELLQSEERDQGAPRDYVVQRRTIVSGDMLTSAQAGTNSQTGEWVVNFRFDSQGARRFGDVTKTNVGRPFAIILDNKVISAPVIREPILGGSGQISGGFTAQGAQDLALLLRAGALPAPLTVLEERTVGPDLGADSIAAGEIASVVAVVLVAVLMITFYGIFGVFAVIALFFNLAIMLALLSVLQATLTLPGIAGIALTLGMAVDANVLIFERIREEVRNGRTPISAIESGHARAFGTIFDGQLTTLIAGILLFWLGSGPIRGFAVTLSLGIFTSLFSAVMVTRLLIIWWIRRSGRLQALPI